MADVIVNVTGNALTVSRGFVSGVRNYQVFRETVFTPSDVNVNVTGVALAITAGRVSGVRDYQVFREAVIDPITVVNVTGNALALSTGIIRGVRDYQVFREAVITPPVNVSVSITGNSIAASLGTPTFSLGVGVHPSGLALTIVVGKLPTPPVDHPSIQFHPILMPLAFSSRPLLQAGRRVRNDGSFLAFLTKPGAFRSLSIPLGTRNQPIPGKLFTFSLGGTITLGSADGTLVITPFYGAEVSGVNLGGSLASPYTASMSPIAWHLKGQIIFQDVVIEPGLSTILCSGAFTMNSNPAVSVVFGSTDPIQVDTSKFTRAASGALNFAATFAPSVLNATPPAITMGYAVLRTI